MTDSRAFDYIARNDYAKALEVYYELLSEHGSSETLRQKIRWCQLRLAKVLDLTSQGLGYKTLSGEPITEEEAEAKLARWQAKNKKQLPKGATKGAIHMAKAKVKKTNKVKEVKRERGRPRLDKTQRDVCESCFNSGWKDNEKIMDRVRKEFPSSHITKATVAVYRSQWKREKERR